VPQFDSLRVASRDRLTSSVRQALASPAHPLDREASHGLGPRLLHDFSRVRIHSDQTSATSAQALSARAYTVGDHIVFGRGQYAPATPAGRALLAHELAHVVQYRRGMIRSTDPGITVSGPADPAERDADHQADQIMAGSAQSMENTPAGGGGQGLSVLRSWQRNDAGFQATTSGERAGLVSAWDIDEDLGSGANSTVSGVAPWGWATVEARRLVHKSSEDPDYGAVKGHLWNGALGGPGESQWNLAPIPQNVNRRMSARAEEPAKTLLRDSPNQMRIWLETSVTYAGSGSSADLTSVMASHIQMTWGLMKGLGQRGRDGRDKAVGHWEEGITLPVEVMSSRAIRSIVQTVNKAVRDKNRDDLLANFVRPSANLATTQAATRATLATTNPQASIDQSNVLVSTTPQQQAEAFQAISFDAQRIVAVNRPDLFCQLSIYAKSELLAEMEDDEHRVLGKEMAPQEVAKHILFPLLTIDPSRVDHAFRNLLDTPAKRHECIKASGWPLLQSLGGATIIDLIEVDSNQVYNLIEDDGLKARLIRDLSPSDRRNKLLKSLNSDQRKDLLMAWIVKDAPPAYQDPSTWANWLSQRGIADTYTGTFGRQVQYGTRGLLKRFEESKEQENKMDTGQ
jgi:hypothetical protein